MIQIATYPLLDEALIVKGMLAGYGIDGHVTPESGLSTIFPAPGAGVATVALYVDRASASRARALLQQHGDN